MEAVITQKETTAIMSKLRNESWGAEEVESKDISIEKVLIAHPQSTVCQDNSIPKGSIYKFPGNTVLGNGSKAFEFIPFIIKKSWQIFNETGSRRLGEESYSDKPDAPLSFTEDGQKKIRSETFNIFALESIDGSVMPIVIPFSKSAYSSGKLIASHFRVNSQMLKQPGCTHHWLMTTKEVTNTAGQKFFVPVLVKGKSTTDKEVTLCHKWWVTMQKTTLKAAQEADLVEEKPVC